MNYLGRIFLIVYIILSSSFALEADDNKTEVKKTVKFQEAYLRDGNDIKVKTQKKIFTIYSADISRSQQRLDRAFEPMAAMDKILDPRSTYSVANLYHAHFYANKGFLGNFETDGGILQKIAVIDDKGDDAAIFDQTYPDCTESKYMLARKGSRIYLLTTKRTQGFGVKPINEPSEQLIIIYVLSANDTAIPFFKQKSKFKSTKAVCDDTETKKLLEEVVSSKL